MTVNKLSPPSLLLFLAVMGLGPAVAAIMAPAPLAAQDWPFDILITNARVVDGTGNPWFRADVGILGDRIVEVGQLSDRRAQRVIDAGDRILSPGFIDLMGQSSQVLITDPGSAESKLRQGITTYLSGETNSAAPQSERTQPQPLVIAGDSLRWRSYPEYFEIMERYGIPLNVIHNVGLAQVRRVVLGGGDIQPTPAQMEEMKALVREGMEAGAVGVSVALIYPPAVYASTEELIELAAVAADYGGVYFTHMRNESNALLEAIREALAIGEGAGVPVHIYHLKAAGQANWDLMPQAIALVDSARAAGMDVTADVYPYIRNGRSFGGRWRPHRIGKTGTSMWEWTGITFSSYRPRLRWAGKSSASR